jgi:hypothetical protein
MTTYELIKIAVEVIRLVADIIFKLRDRKKPRKKK